MRAEPRLQFRQFRAGDAQGMALWIHEAFGVQKIRIHKAGEQQANEKGHLEGHSGFVRGDS
ncbi:hypothetical protein [Desulfocurvus vexinensis]|uniref:hypothetical protein n=1 Tax=Desulfocurvus vexinensis TaxID=399548 RepID=UPI001FE0605A|nr:hypothetical protein [Desulfocurvus vexinensis]